MLGNIPVLFDCGAAHADLQPSFSAPSLPGTFLGAIITTHHSSSLISFRLLPKFRQELNVRHSPRSLVVNGLLGLFHFRQGPLRLGVRFAQDCALGTRCTLWTCF